MAARDSVGACSDAAERPAEQLSGSIERITFHSKESGFCVLRVKAPGRRELATVVGTAVAVGAGEYVECQGWWVTCFATPGSHHRH